MKPDNLFRMLNHRMDYIGQQVKLLMKNMANLHSPGYHAKELRPLDFKVLRSDPGFTITHPSTTKASENFPFVRKMVPKHTKGIT